MKALHGVARRDAGELERCLEEHALHALSLVVVVSLDTAVLVLVLKRIERLAVVQKTRGEDFSGSDKDGVVHIRLFIYDFKAIARLDSEEVDGPSVDFRKLHRHRRRNALLFERSIERTFNLATYGPLFGHLGALDLIDKQAVAQSKHHVFRYRRLVHEVRHLLGAVFAPQQPVGVAGSPFARIEVFFAQLQELVDCSRSDAPRVHEATEGFAFTHFKALGVEVLE